MFSVSSFLSAAIKSILFAVLVFAIAALLLPEGASARSTTHIAEEGFTALPGYECIGVDGYDRMVNSCTGSEIRKVWYRSKTRLCFVSGPVYKNDLPFVFRGDKAYTKNGGKLVHQMTWVDYKGKAQKRHYKAVTKKGTLCKEARPVKRKSSNVGWILLTILGASFVLVIVFAASTTASRKDDK